MSSSTAVMTILRCPDSVVPKLRGRPGDLVEVAGLGETVDFGMVLDDLGARGIGRLVVERGGTIHTQFLTAGLADEIQLAIAPFFVGDAAAPRSLGRASSPAIQPTA